MVAEDHFSRRLLIINPRHFQMIGIIALEVNTADDENPDVRSTALSTECTH